MVNAFLGNNALIINDIKNYWESVVAYLGKGALNPAVFSSWIAPLTPHDMDENNFILTTKSEYIKSTVNSRYADKIAGAFRVVLGREYDVHVLLESEVQKPKPREAGQVKPAAVAVNTANGSNLIPKFIFDSYVKGKCNEFAYAASLAVADEPGGKYNPLYIYGDVGLGKTHLMHAIGNHVLTCNPNAKILYTTSENLVNEFVYAIRHKKNEEFREKYRLVDVLLVDDIQFLSDKDGTQEEFFHTFNALHNDNKQIILTSDKPPTELKSIEDRLRSRFGSGLSVDISLPDLETRTAILMRKVEAERLNVDQEIIELIAKYIQSNIRELEGALNAVTARSRLTGTKCTAEFAKSTLEEMVKQEERQEVNVQFIKEVVAGYFNISMAEMDSGRRTAEIIHARHIAMYISRMLVDKPLKTIGKEFGGRDHSTISHAVDKMIDKMDKDKNLKKEVDGLLKKIRDE
ncbi:MAG: chromosomal replication initiator protein DnaA [Defluviitaleaceae bacterium]|nr:chromosomal replication initiator protein DnaA [Defluviitaleaceae bacterium]